jgi:hypothetical protein
MIKIRKGVFETNSSSTHSLTICSNKNYIAWGKGELVLGDDGKFYTEEEALNKQTKNKWFEFFTQENYGSDYEWFEETYTTENGEQVVAFGYYGYDG